MGRSCETPLRTKAEQLSALKIASDPNGATDRTLACIRSLYAPVCSAIYIPALRTLHASYIPFVPSSSSFSSSFSPISPYLRLPSSRRQQNSSNLPVGILLFRSVTPLSIMKSILRRVSPPPSTVTPLLPATPLPCFLCPGNDAMPSGSGRDLIPIFLSADLLPSLFSLFLSLSFYIVTITFTYPPGSNCHTIHMPMYSKRLATRAPALRGSKTFRQQQVNNNGRRPLHVVPFEYIPVLLVFVGEFESRDIVGGLRLAWRLPCLRSEVSATRTVAPPAPLPVLPIHTHLFTTTNTSTYDFVRLSTNTSSHPSPFVPCWHPLSVRRWTQ